MAAPGPLDLSRVAEDAPDFCQEKSGHVADLTTEKMGQWKVPDVRQRMRGV